jgi:hypothetical protein
MLIWLGALVIPILGLIETGGWSALKARIAREDAGQDYTHRLKVPPARSYALLDPVRRGTSDWVMAFVSFEDIAVTN